jgi:4-amino-4-deoxy-L-arabinose transferase-like glycosyltransferase
LCWAIPAGISGGAQYQHDIFWGQTANRMVNSFAHNRPQWWYLEMAPLLIFPWFFVPAFWKLIFQKSPRPMSEGLKFSLAWFFPVFIAFSLISGKQVHYLLPIYPALALMIASEFDRIKKITLFDNAFITLPLMLAGTIFYFLTSSDRIDHLAPWIDALPIENSIALVLGGLLIFIWKMKNTVTFLWKLVAVNVLLMSVIFLGLYYHTGNAYDLREISITIKSITDKNFPVAFLGNYTGQFDFIGRLKNPPQEITRTQLLNWTKDHPEGRVIITFNGKPDFTKIKTQFNSWYRGSHIAILSSDEVNAFCKPKPDVCLEH